jgi:ATP synthase F1 gamma subunit
MKTLVSIKKDLEFNTGLSSLIEVLKTIAVSQYRALEKKIKSYERLISDIESFFNFIDIKSIDHPLVNPREKRQIVIAVTSDSGLLGGLNMQVVNYALAELERISGKLVVIGERGKVYAREMGVPFVAFSGIKEEERYAQAMQLRDYIIRRVSEESIGHLKVVYPRPVSFTVQRVETVSFLPFAPSTGEGAFREGVSPEIILESDLGDLLAYLLYLWMGQKLFEIFGLSRLAEFAARFVHLEESSEKLKDMDKKLRLQYFRVRHELIDRNMRELFSARLLYVSKNQ